MILCQSWAFGMLAELTNVQPTRNYRFQQVLKITVLLHTHSRHLCKVYIHVLFIIQTNKCTTHTHTYINNIIYIISTPTRFAASASSSGSLILLQC